MSFLKLSIRPLRHHEIPCELPPLPACGFSPATEPAETAHQSPASPFLSSALRPFSWYPVEKLPETLPPSATTIVSN